MQGEFEFCDWVENEGRAVPDTAGVMCILLSVAVRILGLRHGTRGDLSSTMRQK